MPYVKHWLVPLTSLLLLRAVPSCSDDTATGAPTEARLREIPGIFARKACELTLECLGPVADVAALRSDCVERVTRQYEDGEFALFASAIADGRIDYDASKVDACIQSLGDAGCGILVNRFGALCPDLFTGHTEEGGECAVDAECEEGHFCRVDAACPGACAPLSGDGERCLQHADCHDGLICGGGGQCVTPSPDGEACGGDSGRECEPTSVCSGASAQESGVCIGVLDAFTRGEGEACDPSRGEFCSADFVCAALALEEDGRAVYQCEARTEGPSCHVAIPEACPDGEFCKLLDVSLPTEPARVELSGECQPLPGDGEPCEAAQPSVFPPSLCRAGLTCVGDTCREMKRLGGACAVGTECYSGVCTDGTCSATLCGATE